MTSPPALIPAAATDGGREPARSDIPTGGARAVLARVARDRAAMTSLVAITLLIVMALAAEAITAIIGVSPFTFDTAAVDPDLGGLPRGALGGISTTHWLGVEPGSGRDILARLVFGARVSLLIALLATVLSTLLGTVIGLVAGFSGGRIDGFIGRAIDLFMSFPSLIFMIALMSVAPQANREWLLIGVLGLFGWPYTARIVRGQTLILTGREFVAAARALGASRRALLFSEILPNLTSPILVVATLSIPGYIGTEAGLSFLGVGVQAPTPSWGQMIYSAVPWYLSDPMFLAIPCLFLFITVLAFNILGDAVRDAFDPRTHLR